jgi:hypothetical protein
MAITTASSPGPTTATSTIASNIGGKDMKTSMMRLKIVSIQPP